jgi:hypothetical protein
MTIREFSSENACNEAAAKWPKRTRGGISGRFAAVCVAK